MGLAREAAGSAAFGSGGRKKSVPMRCRLVARASSASATQAGVGHKQKRGHIGGGDPIGHQVLSHKGGPSQQSPAALVYRKPLSASAPTKQR